MPPTSPSQPALAIGGPSPPAWRLIERVGEGATSIVWRAKHRQSGREAALKIAKDGHPLLREAELVARIGRRWGPSVLDAGAGFVATEWVEGTPVFEAKRKDRERVAVLVAHAVGSALAELHEAGVRHGDVKPANILLADKAPTKNTAASRGATLIDMGLAGDASDPHLAGGTPRYLAPESRRTGETGPAADLYALGLVLAELLEPKVRASDDPRAAFAAMPARAEAARWAEALLAESPGGRPSAAWIAERAARWLGLAHDKEEAARAGKAQVRRAYLATRSREIRPGARVSDAIGGDARAWLDEALALAASALCAAPAAEHCVEPLTAIGRARWLVALVGPVAASWAVGVEASEEALARRLLELAASAPAASWTLDDVAGRVRAPLGRFVAGKGDDGVARLARELARPSPDPAALAHAEDVIGAGGAPATLAVQLATALLRAGESGRAWAALALAEGPEADAVRADIARRRGDRGRAAQMAERASKSDDAAARASGKATLARLAWDAGELDAADAHLEGVRGAAAAEVRALVLYRRGAYEPGVRVVEEALLETRDGDASARLEATRGLLEHARGAATASLRAFGRAVELATRSASILEEASYLTGEAAAATAAGDIACALTSATRAALLWERLGRPADAARAWLSLAGALATIGAVHAADEAAGEARARAEDSRDPRAAAFARWASVEVRPLGDPRARAEAIAADVALATFDAEDRVRAAARLLVWAPDAIDDARIASADHLASTLSAPARWEWWGARAAAILAGRASSGDAMVLPQLAALVELAAPLSSRGPALDAAARLANERGEGEGGQRFELARRVAARALREGTPPAMRASLAEVPWARTSVESAADVTFAPAQIAQLESIVRALGSRDRLRPLLEQVLDTMVLWTGVERGLLLLRAPDGRLVPRAARNLARKDLTGEQLTLSQGIARRAIETGDAVVATDAFSTLGDMHASVHALRLRSVLAVPLIARGETLGVVYLDDRARKGAFGARELAWVRVVASQAAMAIADARDQALLKRAVRRAERARQRVEAMLREREAELSATRTELEMTRGDEESRFPYDAIAGRSEPMRAMLKLVDRVTASDIPVLVVGESGTGKELIARAIHANGARAKRPFVSENCASVPETLLETTLFGHVKGAFTGASSTRAGLFDVADGGTFFLDEIGEMSLGMQSKLLRVLQDGEVRAVGGERTRKVDVRIIGATHRDLESMVKKGTFREDLFYRLNVITIRVPALRERGADIPLLVAHFAAKHAPGRALKVTRAAMDKLIAYPWPGNVRQLENELRRAIVMADGGIDVSELSADIARGGPSAARGAGLDLRSRVDALGAELVREALEKTKGNQTRAAQLLGLSRFGLQKMLKRLKITGG